MPEEKPAGLPVNPQEVQIQSPSLLDKLKTHKFKILYGVLGVLVFAGVVFGAYKLSQRQIKPGATPTPTPVVVATPTPDQTADWKTYRNEKYGFELKYPANWTIEEAPWTIGEGPYDPEGTIAFKLESEKETCFQLGFWCPVLIKVMPNPQNLTIKDLYESGEAFYPEEETVWGGIHDIIVGGKQAIRLINISNTGNDLVFVPFNGYILEIDLNQEDQLDLTKRQEALDIFDKILSTFKFLD